MSDTKINKNWELAINAYKNIVNNDFLIKDILTQTKPVKIFNNTLYVVSNNDYLIDYLNSNREKISNFFNQFSNEYITLLALNENEWESIKDNLQTENNSVENSYLDKKLNFENYIIGDFNFYAYTLIKNIIKTGTTEFNPIFIYSSTGLGKTHLTSALANAYKSKFPNKNIHYIDAINFTKEIYNALQEGSQQIENLKAKYSNFDLLIIDDIQYLADKTKTNEILFNIFNSLIKNNKILIMTSDKHPDNLHGFEERMISRFSAGITTKIKVPDEESIKNIINEHIKSTNLLINPESIKFICDWFKNDIRVLLGAINKIVFFSKMNNNNVIDEKIIKDILEIETSKTTTIPNNEKLINPVVIINNVAKLYNISNSDITGSSRKKEIVNARHIIMYILKQEFNMPYKEIGVLLGNRDHTTVMNGVEKTKELLYKDKNLITVIESIIKKHN